MIWRLTKLPEEVFVDIIASHIVAYHPWQFSHSTCVKILLSNGAEIDVKENMKTIRHMLDQGCDK